MYISIFRRKILIYLKKILWDKHGIFLTHIWDSGTIIWKVWGNHHYISTGECHCVVSNCLLATFFTSLCSNATVLCAIVLIVMSKCH